MNRKTELLLLAAAVALSLYTHSIVLKEFYMPTYGNTGIHAAPIREFVETGFYSKEDHFSYGGGIPSTYVPFYRMGLASFVMLTGVSVEASSRLWVMVVAALLPLGFYLLGKKVFGPEAGLFAAFFSVVPGELIIYTVRPLPQALAMALVPIALYLVLERKWLASIALTFFTIMTHQEAALYLVAVQFGLAALVFLERAWLFVFKRPESVEARERKQAAMLAFACWGVGVASYFAWHFLVTGTTDFLSMNQFLLHEGTAVGFNEVAGQLGSALPWLAAAGAAVIALRAAAKGWPSAGELLAASAVISGIVLVKNELIGLNVLMQRFIAFLDQGIVLLAGV
ncbi:MAG: hypothetical protein AB1626_06090, partial [Candidatus Micrarchaeota archaeon]